LLTLKGIQKELLTTETKPEFSRYIDTLYIDILYMAHYKLSKSSFMSGIQCLKKFWRERNEPLQLRFTETNNQRFEVGKRVGEFARQQMSNGILISGKDVDDDLTTTKYHLGIGTAAIFEATFMYDEILVKSDILINCGHRGWTLVEVKSGTEVKEEYIFDVALQYYCLVGAGVKIHKVFVRHVNNECVYPNLNNFFTTVDVTDKAIGLQPGIEYAIAEEKKILQLKEEPDNFIGKHCVKPHTCQYKDECWKIVPPQSIFDIPYLGWDKKEDLIVDGIFTLDKIPPLFKLSDNQWKHVKMIKEGNAHIDRYNIKKQLSSLKYPLYFLDFETDAPAIPCFDGMKPYQKYPFQYSCHIIDSNDSLSHVEYVHTEPTDPRRIIAERLLNDLHTCGTIIAYNAQFEISVIKSLAEAFPDLHDKLYALLPRIWDQLEIFKHFYSHPDFHGSNSIKSVLPVLVPELSHKNLVQVHDGMEAGAVWNKAIVDQDEQRKNKAFENLKAYCGLDTLAMVKIHEHLLQLPTVKIIRSAA
jgi:hypothetical protein